VAGGIASFIFSIILTALVRRLSTRAGFLSHPAADRYHKAPVPLGGGIAIFTAIAAFLLAAVFIIKYLVAPGHINWLAPSVTIHAPGFLTKTTPLLVVLGCMLVLFLLGLWDDIRRLGPFSKLTVQFAVALVAAAFADIRLEFFIESRIITSILSAFWIVLIINAFNFLDNMDGLSSGIAVIAVSILLTAAALAGRFS
jgi:UDP-GlcNAc:undecaprenyl-phosphate/decaprenyl-phosphate GlcNAc-1-phosphate transferase